jgi:hypothetical protein
MSRPATRLQLECEAARMPRLFPLMKADLYIYPLTATETQLNFKGVYEPPLGPFGKSRERNGRAPHRGGVRSLAMWRDTSGKPLARRKTSEWLYTKGVGLTVGQ